MKGRGCGLGIFAALNQEKAAKLIHTERNLTNKEIGKLLKHGLEYFKELHANKRAPRSTWKTKKKIPCPSPLGQTFESNPADGEQLEGVESESGQAEDERETGHLNVCTLQPARTY